MTEATVSPAAGSASEPARILSSLLLLSAPIVVSQFAQMASGWAMVGAREISRALPASPRGAWWWGWQAASWWPAFSWPFVWGRA